MSSLTVGFKICVYLDRYSNVLARHRTCFACESRRLWFFCQPVHRACVKMTSRVGKHESSYNGYKTHHTYLTQNNDIEWNFTDVFPSQLKIAKVIPTFEKGDNKIFNNYRPISLLPALSKVVEKVICSQINNFFITNNLFYDSQYGLRPGHSTEYAAIEITDRIITDMDTNKIPLNIYLDLSQAFDTLGHAILLDKLSHYGIRGNPLKLISSYLENRQQFVEFRNTK